VNPVILHFARRDFRDAKLAEEWQQMNPKTDFMPLGPLLAALTLGYDRIFRNELRGGLSKAFLRKENTGMIFTPQSQIPVFGELANENCWLRE